LAIQPEGGAAAPPLLALSGIGKRFGGVTALEGVDFALAPGEIHGLVGENGAGKSTLMKIISGVHADYAGEMRLDGRPVRFRSPKDALAAGIAMVHQELAIVPALSVAENVFLGVQPTGRLGQVRWREMARLAREHLGRLGIDIDVTADAGSLPLGLQQLVEIGRVLFSGARIVILDEPTSALSPPEVERLFEVLKRRRAEGTSFIFISHFLDDILAVSDRVTVFRNARHVGEARADDVDKGWLIERMIGAGHEELEETYTADFTLPPPVNTPAALEVEGFGLKGAFADVGFAVRRGEVVGLYGFMGAGQLELAKALVGKLAHDAGAIRIDGATVRVANTAAAKRAGMAIVAESRRAMLFSDVPVYQNISISVLERISRIWLREGEERRVAEAQIGPLNIRPASVEPRLKTLSGGNQQKVALARWLAYRPGVLVLAEPTRGMDVGAKDDVVKIVRRLREDGMAVLVVSAEPETVLALADRILVMRRGRITHEFAHTKVSKDRLLAAA